MLLFTACISLSIALVMSLLYKETENSRGFGDTKVTIGIKAFVISFIAVYFGLVFFAPTSNMVMKGQLIETCEPDF